MAVRSVLALSVLLVAACGGKISDGDGGVLDPADVCTRVLALHCPNDEPAMDQTVAQCRAAIQGSCGQELGAMYACVAAHSHCSPDGYRDITPSGEACLGQGDAYRACLGAEDPPRPPG